MSPEMDSIGTVTHEVLLFVIAELANAGTTVPCRQVEVRDYWTSDLAEELEAAVHRCRPCPVARCCRSYGVANPLEVGVYGALTRPQRAARAGEST